MDLDALKIQKVLIECDKHLLRINSAHQDMQTFMPLTASAYDTLSKSNVQALDQYLYRFSKLQDAMGEKLFKRLVARYEEDIETLSFIDILNKLEKLKLIKQADDWKMLRKIRNDLAHEYEDEPEQLVVTLNRIFEKKSIIETIYLEMSQFVKNGYKP